MQFKSFWLCCPLCKEIFLKKVRVNLKTRGSGKVLDFISIKGKEADP